MSERKMQTNLRLRVIRLAFVAAVLPVVAVLGITIILKGSVDRRIVDELREVSTKNVELVTQNIYTVCATVDNLVRGKLQSSLRSAIYLVDLHRGLVPKGEQRTWDAINEETGQVVKTVLPVITLGVSSLTGQDNSTPQSLVEQIKKLSGMESSLYQKMCE